MTILDSAAAVLKCLSEEAPDLTVSDLVRHLGMPKSNASRLLRAMRDAGMLENVGDTKRYRPSLMLVDLGLAYRRSSTLVDRANTAVMRLMRDYGHTAFVSKRKGATVYGVVDHMGTNPVQVGTSAVRRMPAFACASGRSLLARLDDREVHSLYGGELPPPPSPNAPQSFDELLSRLRETRISGVARSHDEAHRGVAAVAVAVSDRETNEEVAFGLVFPAASVGMDEISAISASLRRAANELELAVPNAQGRARNANSRLS